MNHGGFEELGKDDCFDRRFDETEEALCAYRAPLSKFENNYPEET